MKNDFEEFQRESPVGVLMLFANTLRKEIGQLIAFLAVGFLSENLRQFIGLFFTLFIVYLALRSYLKYRNYLFRIDTVNEEFQLKQGILKTSLTLIPLKNIQNTELSQNYIEKIFNVYKLQIDSTGSENEEVNQLVLGQAKALELQKLLISKNAKEVSLNEKQITEQLSTSHIPLQNLILSAIYTNHFRTISLAATVLIALYSRVNNFVDEEQERNWLKNAMMYLYNSDFMSYILVLIFLLLCFVIMISIVRNLFFYFPFQFTISSWRIGLRYGYFQKKNLNVVASKIQIMQIKQNFFEKLNNLSNLKFTQINESANNKKNNVKIPALKSHQLDEIVEALDMPYHFQNSYKPHYFLIFKNVRNLIILGLVFSCIWYVYSPVEYFWNGEYSIILITLILLVLRMIKYKNTYSYISSKMIASETGVYDLTKDLAKIENIQSIEIRQNIFYKKREIGNVRFKTAGGNINFTFLPQKSINKFSNFVLYQLESKSFHRL